MNKFNYIYNKNSAKVTQGIGGVYMGVSAGYERQFRTSNGVEGYKAGSDVHKLGASVPSGIPFLVIAANADSKGKSKTGVQISAGAALLLGVKGEAFLGLIRR